MVAVECDSRRVDPALVDPAGQAQHDRFIETPAAGGGEKKSVPAMEQRVAVVEAKVSSIETGLQEQDVADLVKIETASFFEHMEGL